ncbi:MAG: FHA domain-containing protein [Planctomycetota bacterium]
MKCPKCGYQNKPEAEICGLCKSVRFVKSGTGAETAPQAVAPAGKKHLLVRVGAPPLELEPGKDFTFGRAPTCSFSIPSPRVSREHAVISWPGGKPVLTDKGSSNGTFVGGKRIVKEQALVSGDEIEVGPFTCTYRFDEPNKKGVLGDMPGDMQTIADAGDLLSGAIGEAGLAEVLQGLEFNTKTGTLAVFSKTGDGWFAVDKGLPIAAEAGEGLKDEEAVIFLLMLKQGRFTFAPDLKESTRRIKPTITGLLLEWGRRADERSGS